MNVQTLRERPSAPARTRTAPLGHAPRPPSAALVRYGSLDMPASAKPDFDLAVAYLSRDGGERDIIERAEHADVPLHLRINAEDDDSFDPATNTVNWDPHSALRTTAGGTQSPALGLGHELDHATVDSVVRARGSASPGGRYDNLEEKRVIEGSELHAARTLGEGVRHDHGGSVFGVSSPVER